MNSLQVIKKGIKRNEIVVYAIALMLVTAGYFNYSANSEHNVVETVSEESLDLNEDKDEDEIHKGVLEEETVEEISEGELVANEEKKEELGDARLVNSEDVVEESKDITSDYFASSKLERDRSYADMISTYSKIIEDGSISETQKAIAMNEITKINNEKNAISISENLLSTKNLKNSLVLVNNDSINIVVEVDDDLTKEKVAQIQNIISREFDAEISKIHISEYTN